MVGWRIIGRGSIAVLITRGLVLVLVLVILFVSTSREDGEDVEGSPVFVAWFAGLAVLVARRRVVTDRGPIAVTWLLVLILVLVLVFVAKCPPASAVWSSIPRAGDTVA